MKLCKQCGGEFPLSLFPKSKPGKDGHKNQCKGCVKKRLVKYFKENKDRIQAVTKVYRSTEQGKSASYKGHQKQKLKFPEKIKARQRVNDYLRRGKGEKFPCCICGNIKSQGHHENYDKPLNVIWLCPKHHTAAHKLQKIGERLNEIKVA